MTSTCKIRNDATEDLSFAYLEHLQFVNICLKGNENNVSTSCFWFFSEERADRMPSTRCFHSALSFVFSWVTAQLSGEWAAPTQPLWLDGAKTPRWLRRSASEEVHTQVGIQLPAISGHSLFVVRAAVPQLHSFSFFFFRKLFLATLMHICQLEKRLSRTPSCKAHPLVYDKQIGLL